MASQPRPRAPTHSQRKAREVDRLVHPARPAALAAHDLLDQVPARAALVEPQPPAAGIVRPVDELIPVDVVDVALRAGADEPGGDDRALPVVAAVGEGGARNHAPRARAGSSPGTRAGTGFLHHEPLGESPRTDSSLVILPAIRLGWRRIEPRIRNARHGHQLGREARFVDRFQIGRLAAPGIESPHNGRIVQAGSIRAPGPERGDHLAAAQLPMCLSCSCAAAPARARLGEVLQEQISPAAQRRASDHTARNFLWW